MTEEPAAEGGDKKAAGPAFEGGPAHAAGNPALPPQSTTTASTAIPLHV